MNSYLSQPNGAVTPHSLPKSEKIRSHDSVNDSVLTQPVRKEPVFHRGMSKKGARTLHPIKFISKEDDDMAVAERLHFLVTEVVKATEADFT